MQQMIITFVHCMAVNKETGEIEKDDIPKIDCRNGHILMIR